MRRLQKILIFSLCLFILAVQSADAMDALLGEVDAIDAENRRMVVFVDQSGDTGGTRKVVVSYDRQKLPGFVQPGALVRLWGEYMSENGSEFRMQSLRNGETLNGKDPTGVRSRLKQGHGRHGMGMGGDRGNRRP